MTEKKHYRKSSQRNGSFVVKTGPTAGDNRSRTNKGPWRAQRSDAGSSRK